MSYKNNMDLRNREGGWFYAEREIFSVFAPLIEATGVVVYMAMCRLIPLASVDPDRQVSIGTVMAESCVKRTTAGEKMREIVALGMVLEQKNPVKNRPSTYKLVQLKTLAHVGLAELEARLRREIGWKEFRRRLAERVGADEMVARFGVRWADTTEEEAFPTSVSMAPQDTSPDAHKGESSGDADRGGAGNVRRGVEAPIAAGESGVRGADTDAEDGPKHSAEGKTERNGGIGVRPADVLFATEASVSATDPLGVRQDANIVKQEKEEDRKASTPPTPVPGVLDGNELILPFPDRRHGEAGFAQSAAVAAEWVLNQNGTVTGIRRGRAVVAVVVEALTLRARLTREPLEIVTEVAAGNLRVYLRDHDLLLFAWSLPNFFCSGHVWNTRTWRYDEAKLAQARQAATGAGRQSAVASEPESDGAESGAVRGVTLDSWELVTREMRAKLEAMSAGDFRERSLETFARSIEPAVVAEMLEGGLVWRLASRDAKATKAAMALLRNYVNMAVHRVAGRLVKFEYVQLAKGDEDDDDGR